MGRRPEYWRPGLVLLLPLGHNTRMSSLQTVAIHSSQHPERVRCDLLDSLRGRRIDHKFLYDSLKQTQKWLALHAAHAPRYQDPDRPGVYQRSFAATAARLRADKVHVLSLGCGGGQKDALLLEALRAAGKAVRYTPTDVSVPLVLLASDAARKIRQVDLGLPLVCDLASTDDPTAELNRRAGEWGTPLVCFFGMLPNFEPAQILPRLARLLQERAADVAAGRPREGAWLLMSANLAPGRNYDAGLKKILPQYDNALTRDWLMGFLLDLGFEATDGKLGFAVEPGREGVDLKRVVARFEIAAHRAIQLHGKRFVFRPPQSIRTFFSYRHTPARLDRLLRSYGLDIPGQWLDESGEEGVFLCTRSPSA